jgi:hypothetical protein
MSTVKFPFGPADTLALTATGAQALTIANTATIVDGVTTISTATRTLNLAIDAAVPAGAKIFVKAKFTGTETLVFGTGFLCPTLTGVAAKEFNVEFTYDGTTFKPTAAPYQVN